MAHYNLEEKLISNLSNYIITIEARIKIPKKEYEDLKKGQK